MEDSSSIQDLRENPLMLALLCNLYRQDGYLPKFRPDVYQRCADLLFEKWDKSRQIKSGLSVEYHLKPIMRHLAQWIYGNVGLQQGVTERELLREITRYLLPFTDSPALAESYAGEFADFLRGRAWVFSDTGSTESELLYTFTHRTFLEYFTAEFLVGAGQGAKNLSERLLGHIQLQEWDIVCQLCYQMQARLYLEAADELILGLIVRKNSGLEKKLQLNVLLFMARILKLIQPRNEVRLAAIREVIEELFEAIASLSSNESEAVVSEIDELHDELLKAVVNLEVTGGPQIATHAVEAAVKYVKDESQFEVLLMLFEFIKSTNRERFPHAQRNEYPASKWMQAVSNQEQLLCERILKVEADSLRYALIRTLEGQIDVGRLVGTHGRRAMLIPRRDGFQQGFYIPILPMIVFDIIRGQNSREICYSPSWLADELIRSPLPFADVTGILPWIDMRSFVDIDPTQSKWPHGKPEECAISSIAFILSGTRGSRKVTLKEAAQITHLRRLRGSLSKAEISERVASLGVTGDHAHVLEVWAAGDIDFVTGMVPDSPE